MEESPGGGESLKASCERCRRRKIKCDRKRPCFRCAKAGTECVLHGTGEKSRPASKTYVAALERHIVALEQVIKKLAAATNEERDQILSDFTLGGPAQPGPSQPVEDNVDVKTDPSLDAARIRSGQLRRVKACNAAEFFGSTSLFQIQFSQDSSAVPTTTELDTNLVPVEHQIDFSLADIVAAGNGDDSSPRNGDFQYAPHDEVVQKLMATFFKEQYPYNMVVYREFYLRDYDIGSGKYYSDVLLYSICALAAMQYDATLSLSDVFASHAQNLLYSMLDSPNLTTLQALVLMGYREIAVGKTSKGWLFCGMAFRLAHEMGLHLDPSNWGGSNESRSEREILRRVYWAVFVADKQLSLYFGRPPALYPGESDVRNTIRLQYPPDWQGLLETYICKGMSATQFEDGVSLVGSFIHQAELSKITHLMITDLFENRRGEANAAIVAAKSRRIHVALTKWLSSLPGMLHWNQWTVGQVPCYVLHLHMVFHTVMIILHRPPSHMFEQPGIAESEDVEICYESLQAILRLMRSYSRYYRYRSLPLDFVHTLSTIAGTVMMKRFLTKASWSDPDVERSMALILGAMEEIQGTWPCVREIKEVLVRARQTQATALPVDPLNAPDLMDGLDGVTAAAAAAAADAGGFMDPFVGDIGMLLTDEFLSAQLQGADAGDVAFDFNRAFGL